MLWEKIQLLKYMSYDKSFKILTKNSLLKPSDPVFTSHHLATLEDSQWSRPRLQTWPQFSTLRYCQFWSYEINYSSEN